MAEEHTPVYESNLGAATHENAGLGGDWIQPELVNCKFCGASHPVRYGYSKGVQCWKCKKCHRKFVDNKAAPRMKTPKEQIAYVLSTYYEGMGFKLACRNLREKCNSFPSDSTYYEWIDRFTQKAIEESREDRPQAGKVWITLASPLEIGGDQVWCWDVFDIKTRFLLASNLSKDLTPEDAKTALTQAIKLVGHEPRAILVDGPVAGFEGPQPGFKSKRLRVIHTDFLNAAGRRLLARFRTHLSARTAIMKRCKQMNSLRRVHHGWQVHYNYLRPYEILNQCTPAFQANILRSRLNSEVRKYYINGFWHLWSATLKYQKNGFYA